MNTNNMRIPSNRVRDIEHYFHNELSELYPEGEIKMFVRMLFEAFLGWDMAQLLLHREDTINQSDLLKFHWAVEDLKKHRPIQHIIGHTEFCGLHIEVSPEVLIPRPETEEIILQFLNNRNTQTAPAILDLCTGSGCIAIALSKYFPEANVFGVDISETALQMAQKNAKNNNVEVNFVRCDILRDEPPLPYTTFDYIFSNPPYVLDSERKEMQENVLGYEPSLALFVPDNDPLLFYRVIGLYASKHLAEGGQLILEINEHHGRETCQLLQSLGFATRLNKDFRDKDRSIIATL